MFQKNERNAENREARDAQLDADINDARAGGDIRRARGVLGSHALHHHQAAREEIRGILQVRNFFLVHVAMHRFRVAQATVATVATCWPMAICLAN